MTVAFWFPATRGDIQRVLDAIAQLKKDITTMSQTLEQQLAAGLRTLSDDMTQLTTDLAAIAAALQPGNMITQADIDALNAVVASANQVVATANGLVPAPPQP